MTFFAEPEFDAQLVADVESSFATEDVNAMDIRTDPDGFIADFLDRGDR